MIFNTNFGVSLGQRHKWQQQGFIMNMVYASSVKIGGDYKLIGNAGVGLFSIIGVKDGNDYKLIGNGKQN